MNECRTARRWPALPWRCAFAHDGHGARRRALARHRHAGLRRASRWLAAARHLAVGAASDDPRRTPHRRPATTTLNPGRRTLTWWSRTRGDRPIQVGSHYHFAETNGALHFDRDAARGMRLNIASGTAVRFEPGQQRTVELVDYAGDRAVYGFRGLVQGKL